MSNTGWTETSIGAYAVYPHASIEGLNSDAEVLEAYGALYNWYAVETGNLCPTGWRVPSNGDWSQLANYLINNYEHITSNNEVARVLKSCRQVDSPLGGECDTSGHPRWTSYSSDYYGTDEFMFSALPGGVRPFQGVGSIGYWWSSSEVLS